MKPKSQEDTDKDDLGRCPARQNRQNGYHVFDTVAGLTRGEWVWASKDTFEEARR